MINKISFIGAGAMAEALISGMIQAKFLQGNQITVTNNQNQARLDELHGKYEIQCTSNKEESIHGADILVLSVKPHDIKSAIDSIKDYVTADQLIVSVIAGVSTNHILDLFEKEIAIIRAMPNTSASIGFSATAITKGKYATNEQVTLCQDLLQTIGRSVVVEEEKMDAVTGLSGSGPAYVYYLVEAMEEAAAKMDLDPKIAKSLIIQTVIGAGEMLKQSNASAEQLRENVTSPAGTTEAGIHKLMEYDFKEAMMDCILTARDRSEELGKKL